MQKLKSIFSAVRRGLSRAIATTAARMQFAAATLLAPIGFREVLLLSGAALLGSGAYLVYPPAAYIAPGVILVCVAIFGVRS